MAKADLNKDGRLSKREAALKAADMEKQYLRGKRSRMTDTNKDGLLTRREMAQQRTRDKRSFRADRKTYRKAFKEEKRKARARSLSHRSSSLAGPADAAMNTG